MKGRQGQSSEKQRRRSQPISYDGRPRRKTQSMIWWLNVCLLAIGFVCVLFSIYLWQTTSLWWAGPTMALRFLIFSSFAVVIALLGIQGTCRPTTELCDMPIYLLLIGVLIVAQIIVFIEVILNSDIEQKLHDIWNEWSDSKKLVCMVKYDCGFFYPYTLFVGSTDITLKPHDFENCVDSGVDYCFKSCYSLSKYAVETLRWVFIWFVVLVTVWEIILGLLSIVYLCKSDGCSCSSQKGQDTESIQGNLKGRGQYRARREQERKPFVAPSQATPVSPPQAMKARSDSTGRPVKI